MAVPSVKQPCCPLHLLFLNCCCIVYLALKEVKLQQPNNPSCGGPAALLTGPVGQLFASHLGEQRFASLGCTHLAMVPGSPVSLGNPNVIPDRSVLLQILLRPTIATGCLSHAFPGSILLLAGPPPPSNAVTN